MTEDEMIAQAIQESLKISGDQGDKVPEQKD